MRIGKNPFRRKAKAAPERKRHSHRRSTAPAVVEALEDRVLLAATVYQTPIDIDVSTQPSRSQSIPQVGMADNGDFVVVWEDVLNEDTAEEQADIAFRRYNADGTPKDAAQRYVVASGFDEANLAVAVAGTGGFVVAWQQFDPVTGYDIWYARYNAGGNLIVAPTRANVNTAGNQLNPTAVISDDGTMIIAWEDFGVDSNGDIAVRRFDIGGPIDSDEFYVASTFGLLELEPDLAINAATNDWVITWSQGEFTGVSQPLDVWYELRAANGTVVERDRANVTVINDQNRSSVAMAENGAFVITWESEQSPTLPNDEVNDVAFRRFTPLGVPVDLTDVLVAADPNLDEQDPVAAININATQFVIAFEIADPANRFATAGVAFRVYDANATPISGPSAVAGVPVEDASISMNPLGDFVLAYKEFGVNPFASVSATVVPLLRSSEIVTAAGPGGGAVVRVVDRLTGLATRTFFAFPTSFRGGITVATGDLNDDTFPEIIVGVASDGLPAVRVFDGASGAMISNFLAFPAAFRKGLTVAVGDVTGDGTLDVVVGARAGGGPAVRVFNGLTGAQIGSQFFAFDPAFRGGVNVATGDIDADGTDEIIVGAGPGGDPLVRIFNFNTLTGVQISEFLAFPLGFPGGVFVTAGDLDENGTSEIVVGAGPGGGPAVRIFAPNGTQIGSQFLAFHPAFRGGVHVATGDVNGDTETEIIVGAGPGGGPAVRTFDPDTGAEVGTQFLAFQSVFRGGVFVAGRALGQLGEGSPLTIDRSTPPLADSSPAIENQDVVEIVAAAQTRLGLAGLAPELLAALSEVEFFVTDLGGDLLGVARSGRIWIDDDAAGYGWFVDYSPLLDEEFVGSDSDLAAIDGGAASGRVDLLTAVLHEFGHVLGLEHGGGFMRETLAVGARRLPTREDLDALFAEDDLLAIG